MLTLILPRYVITKNLKSGKIGFYFNPPTAYRQLGCPVRGQPLGTDYTIACGEDGNGGRAATLNVMIDEWRNSKKGIPIAGPREPLLGTVGWTFKTYRSINAYLEKVSPRSRPDYERTMQLVEGIVTKRGDKLRDCPIKSISPRAADKIYEIILNGPDGERPRQAEKAVALCRRAWRVIHRLYPNEFDHRVPNPWDGVTIKRRVKKKKPAVTREDVYRFAWGCIERGRPEPAAVAVICFEFLQRPENVIAGALRWTDYRNKDWPTSVKILHFKTGAVVWHPLEDEHGVKFYEEAEAVLAKLPRRGIPMVLREVVAQQGSTYKPYSIPGMQKLIQVMRKRIGLPSHFTLDACRHGGMTEIEEAELTEGQGRALSGHKTAQAYRGYAKETVERALAATRKRHAHRLANTQGTNIQNGGEIDIQNDTGDQREANAK